MRNNLYTSQHSMCQLRAPRNFIEAKTILTIYNPNVQAKNVAITGSPFVMCDIRLTSRTFFVA